MRRFLDEWKSANDRIHPDESLMKSVLQTIEDERVGNTGDAPKATTAVPFPRPTISRRRFFTVAAAAASAILFTELGVLSIVPARASTDLAYPRVILRNEYWSSIGLEKQGMVTVDLDADFSCVDSNGRDVQVMAQRTGPLSLADEHGNPVEALTLPAESRMRGIIRIEVPATEEERALILDGCRPTQCRKTYECLRVADGASILVKAEGLHPAEYELRTGHIQSWEDLRHKASAGDSLHIDLVKS